MEPYAKMATHFGLDDIAAYFASQPRQPTPMKADPAAVERGREAAGQCAVCHGTNGKSDRVKLAAKLLIQSIPEETLGDLAAHYSTLT